MKNVPRAKQETCESDWFCSPRWFWGYNVPRRRQPKKPTEENPVFTGAFDGLRKLASDLNRPGRQESDSEKASQSQTVGQGMGQMLI